MTFITSIKARILSRSAEAELKLKLLYWSCWFDSYVKTNKKCFDLWPVKHTCQKRLGFITSDVFGWKLYLLLVCRGCSHSPKPPPQSKPPHQWSFQTSSASRSDLPYLHRSRLCWYQTWFLCVCLWHIYDLTSFKNGKNTVGWTEQSTDFTASQPRPWW